MRPIKVILISLLFVSVVGVCTMMAFAYVGLKGDLVSAKMSRTNFVKSTSITDRELSIYRAMVDPNERILEVLRAVPSSRKTMLMHHLESWARYHLLKLLFSDLENTEVGLNLAFMGFDESGKEVRGYIDAAQLYFCKPIHSLDLNEIAQLFAIRRSPQIAMKDKIALKHWRDENLRKMVAASLLSQDDYRRMIDIAVKEPCHGSVSR